MPSDAPIALDSIEQMFYLGPMTALPADVTAAVASLQARWGAAAPRITEGGGPPRTEGSLALAPLSAAVPAAEAGAAVLPDPAPRPDPTTGRVIPTGFGALDALLGPGGLPRSASVAIRGDGSSGRTTLVLRTAAEAQATGAIVAWIDLTRSFDPVEAVARGVRLEWLVVVTPADLDEGLAIGGALLAGRSVDLLVLDLPGGRGASRQPAAVADRLGRLAALARRSETLFIVLEPPGLTGSLAGAVAGSTSLRLELERRSWIRLGRDVVGQRTEARVARNRHGPPGRRATLRIIYADGGERDACLRRDDLLVDQLIEVDRRPGVDQPVPAPAIPSERTHCDATAPPPSTPPSSPARAGARLRALPDGSARAGRATVGSGPGHRRRSGSPGAGHPARDAARERAPARS
jgi:RecA/RadA recombinase